MLRISWLLQCWTASMWDEISVCCRITHAADWCAFSFCYLKPRINPPKSKISDRQHTSPQSTNIPFQTTLLCAHSPSSLLQYIFNEYISSQRTTCNIELPTSSYSFRLTHIFLNVAKLANIPNTGTLGKKRYSYLHTFRRPIPYLVQQSIAQAR